MYYYYKIEKYNYIL